MGFKEDIAKASSERPKPVLVEIVVGDVLYQVEVSRLDGMQWAGVMAEAPPVDAASARLSYSPSVAALVACKRFSRLLDADGEQIPDVNWDELFAAISGIEVQGIAATWFTLNMGDPNQRVVDMKKAFTGGGKTS